MGNGATSTSRGWARRLLSSRLWRQPTRPWALPVVAAALLALVIGSVSTQSPSPARTTTARPLPVRDCLTLHSRLRHTLEWMVARGKRHDLKRDDPQAMARIRGLTDLATVDRVRASGRLAVDLGRLHAALVALRATLARPRRWDLRDDAMAQVGNRTAAVWKRCGGQTAPRPQLLPGPSDTPAGGPHTAADSPNYWAYAKHFVLQDHMFEPNLGWSQPSHLSMVSAWSAVCRDPYIAGSCHPSITFTDIDRAWPHQPSYGWTDITYLMRQHHVSWRFYVAPGSVNDCEGTTDEQIHCTPGVPGFDPIGTPEPWNPLPDFSDVRRAHQVKFVQFHARFFKAAADGDLPQVSWIEPDWYHSEHPPEPISLGQAWVTRVINAVMSGPDWKSTAIFVAWDDWGGFYDHVVPPSVDGEGYGLRVPAFLVSPYAKAGMVDHALYSFDAYLKLVEDLFMGGARLDPYRDGRWDARPDVRETASIQGNLLDEFNFDQKPIPPMILPLHPR